MRIQDNYGLWHSFLLNSAMPLLRVILSLPCILQPLMHHSGSYNEWQCLPNRTSHSTPLVASPNQSRSCIFGQLCFLTSVSSELTALPWQYILSSTRLLLILGGQYRVFLLLETWYLPPFEVRQLIQERYPYSVSNSIPLCASIVVLEASWEPNFVRASFALSIHSPPS